MSDGSDHEEYSIILKGSIGNLKEKSLERRNFELGMLDEERWGNNTPCHHGDKQEDIKRMMASEKCSWLHNAHCTMHKAHRVGL